VDVSSLETVVSNDFCVVDPAISGVVSSTDDLGVVVTISVVFSMVVVVSTSL